GWLVLSGALTIAATSALAPGAQASVVPTLALDQSAGTAAGSSTNLGVDLKFSSTAGDSPKQLTLNLPPGLLANASINGGACLASADLDDSACEVGSGVVTANLLGTIPVPAQVTFDLVPPPAPGDLAGLAVNSNGTQIGTTGDIRVRPSGDPAGVGVTLNLTLPNSLSSTPISITEIKSTFDALRYPTTCPATPQSFTATVDSYNDPTLQTVAAPLSVTGCSALPYAPAFSVTAVRDRADRQVSLSTTVTQRSTEAPSRSVTLAFPSPTLVPNIQVAGALCADIASGTCTPVGSVTASSPLYPRTLTGQAYLTGNILGPSLTLVFPPPFPLTLSGAVDLTKNTTTFTGLPDIPLTNLTVSLNPGPEAVFGTTCKPPTNTATAMLTNQNGDHTVTVPANFTISGCPGSGGSGKGNGGGTQGGRGKLKVRNAFIAGLSTGHPSLGFGIRAAKGTPGLDKVTIVLPSGLGFISHRVGRRIVVNGVHVSGGRGVTFSLSNGHLVITLRKPAAGLRVRLGSRALKESPARKRKARAHRLPRLFLSLITANATGRRTAVRVHLVITGRHG
ncbi:MAG TPA: hypothetical protein VJU80_18030, partial [Solirubrobacteraceae bacterium]|nr:hypothetical protein [Solirubrobacteraceae bacterium]